MPFFSGWTLTRTRGSYALQACFAVSLLIASFTLAYSQGSGGTDSMGTGGRHTIQGRIFFPSGRTADLRAKVKLDGTNTSGLYVLADSDGAFRFRNLEPGKYQLTVEAGEAYETATESVYIEGNSSIGGGLRVPSPARTLQVPIYLQLKPTNRAANRPGVINAALAAVPKDASDLYNKALESIQAGDSRRAIDELRDAISLYPQFPLALNELGVQYLKLGQSNKAAQVLQSAVQISPDAVVPRLNYGIALLEERKFAESETQLREVLTKNDGAATAHLYLGITQIHLHRRDEAEKQLQRAIGIAGNELSLAHYYLGGIYWAKHDYEHAINELETYLRLVPNAPDAERTRATIKELRVKHPTSQ
jgi:tetratricopeptide (TPR) repeat protein